MITLTDTILLHIAPQANRDIVEGLIAPLNLYLPQYGIDTLLRLDHFLGQGAEETAGFRTLTEYASGREYEGRHDLGNIQAGDGERFKGRGIFQITGRANYTTMSHVLGVDLVNNPQLAASPEIAVRTACEYWKSHGLAALADNDDLEGITRRINGGTNGINDRETYTDRADNIISPLFTQ
jgi:putative chitinase